MHRKLKFAVVLAATAIGLALPGSASADTVCDVVAATNGSDLNVGTLAKPLRSSDAAVNSLLD